MKHFVLFCLPALLVFGIETETATAQLPSESTLPGRPPVPVELPSESTLPSRSGATLRPNQYHDTAQPDGNPDALTPKDATDPADQAGPGHPNGVSLPSESTLPVAEGQDPDVSDGRNDAAAGGNALDDSPLQLANSLDNRPWLRLLPRGSIGRVRSLVFSSDSQQLCAAGDNKEVVIWNHQPRTPAAEGPTWQYTRTLRWQIQRGEAGRIYAMSSAPNLLAIGGYGAMGSLGEILLLHPDQGALVAPLMDPKRGNRKRITSLAIAPGRAPNSLSSIDTSGRLVHWQRNDKGIWQATTLSEDPPGRAAQLSRFRVLHPIVMLDDRHVVVPHFDRFNRRRECVWHLQSFDTRTRQSTVVSRDDHMRMVTAMAASPDGRRLASADEYGQLFFWKLKPTPTRVRQVLDRPVTALAFSSDGHWLVAGTAAVSAELPASVQLWDVRDMMKPRRVETIPARDTVLAVAVSPDNQWFAFGDGSAVRLRSLGSSDGVDVTLRSSIQPPTRVAFSSDDQSYRVAFGRHGDRSLEQVFDLERLQLDPEQETIDPNRWNTAPDNEGDDKWSVRSITENGQVRYWTYQGQQRRGRIPLRVEDHGAITTATWIADQNGEIRHVIIGTNGQSNIYVFRLIEQGVCTFQRQLRGHTARVNSLSVSPDRDYLASASRDGTIRIWNLSGLEAASSSMNRWGVEFSKQDGNVVVSSISKAGPLYFRGIRQGDTITRLRLPMEAGGQFTIRTLESADEILRALQAWPMDRLVAFDYQRGRVAQQAFQSFPAWHPLASLFVDEQREWAYWSPSGYYDASFEGHKLFGWQVNRGLQALPDFFRAAELRRFLERPDMMSRLLRAGNLDDAFQQANLQAPGNWHRVLSDSHRLQPRVEIRSHRVDDGVATMDATVTVPVAAQLVPPKAFANGIVASQRTQTAVRTVDDQAEYDFRWQIRLPADRRIKLQVFASTESEIVGQAEAVVLQDVPTDRSQTSRSQVFIAAAGVNDYRDGQVPDLDFAVRNALSVVETLTDHAEPLYRPTAVTFLDQSATRSSWRYTLENYASKIQSRVQPNDLLVLFLSGHGVRSAETGEYFYVTSDARYADLKAQQFSDCISFADLAVFADVPCRKLIILDTCHSGAIAPLDQRELKAGLRALQDDLMLTMTASEGTQEAVEDRQRRLGRFTFRLLEALRGAADARPYGNQDQRVSLRETVAYVRDRVATDAHENGVTQYPTAGPSELLDVIELPMTAY